MIKWLRNLINTRVEDRLYADAVREDAIKSGVTGKDLDDLVEEALLLRKALRDTRLRSSEEE